MLILAKNALEQNLCKNCKYFIRDIDSEIKYGKCSLFVNEDTSVYYLVDGVDNRKNNFHYCSVARKIDSMCGESGKFYKKNENNTVLIPDNTSYLPSRKWFLW